LSLEEEYVAVININNIDVTDKIRKSLDRRFDSKVASENIPIIGTTKAMFITFEPITFPMTMSFLFLIIADIVAASSGKLVPIAMIVSPIIT
jgi:hypothetical protein